jgi:hypothetical protein
MNLTDLQQFANESTDERVKCLWQQLQVARSRAAKNQRKKDELAKENARIRKLLRRVANRILVERPSLYQTIIMDNETMDEIGEVYL